MTGSASPVFHRFVALGDSLTEGVGDPTPRGLRGWADRLADALRAVNPDLAYVKLARRGLATRQILESQLEPALAFRPDLASVMSGMNDIIAPWFDVEPVAGDLDRMIGELTRAGATVLTATLPDATRRLPLPASVAGSFRGRLRSLNDAIRETARTYDALLIDVEPMPEARARGVLSIDRLHPSPRGHLLLAHAAAALLSERTGVALDLPDPAGSGLGAGWLRQGGWLVRNASPLEVARTMRRTRAARRGPRPSGRPT